MAKDLYVSMRVKSVPEVLDTSVPLLLPSSVGSCFFSSGFKDTNSRAPFTGPCPLEASAARLATLFRTR